MSETARNWLPNDAFSSPALADAVVAAVDQWAARWLGARAPVLQSAPRAGAERRLAPGKRWHCLVRGVWLEWSEPTQLDLARLALDRGQKGRVQSEDDKRLLLLFAARMAQELGTLLARLLGASPVPAAEAGAGRAPPRGLLANWSSDPGHAALELLIAHDALAALRLRQCPRAERPARHMVKLADLVGAERVAVEAVLGAVRISALELNEIAIGDVVVIDRVEADLVELRRAGAVRVLAQAQLVREGDNLILKSRMT